jgi:hypothetical protein
MPGLLRQQCPRCRGRMMYEDDRYGRTATCFTCGFVRNELQLQVDQAEPPLASSLREHRPAHGKGNRRFRL